MIRYKNRLQINTNRNGQISIDTDTGQTWNTTIVKTANPLGEWLNSHRTDLRQWQRDYLDIIHQAFNHVEGLHPIEIYWVYQRGHGYLDQSVDIAFARIPTLNVWILMTPANTWVVENAYENFAISVDDAIGPVNDRAVRDELYQWRDSLRGIKTKNKIYTDQDYLNRGLG